MYGVDQEFGSALLQVEREALERAGELGRRAEDLSADIARLIADLSRERSERARERQQWARARAGLAEDLARTNARLNDRTRTMDILQSQLRLLKSAARRMVTAHAEGTAVQEDDAAHELRKLLR